MNIGDYVRTNDGILWKPKEIEKSDEHEYCFDDYYYYKDDEIKSSPNIIDLIEVGDYVNGRLVLSTGDKAITINDVDGYGTPTIIFESEIKSIVTKEQFESMEYKVGDNK